MIPNRPVAPLGEGIYNSRITKLVTDKNNADRFKVEYLLTNDDGVGYTFAEIFINSAKSRRFQDFLSHLDRSLDHEIEDLEEAVGLCERVTLKLGDEVNGRRFLGIVSREFTSYEGEKLS